MKTEFSKKILSWFRVNQRSMPWRNVSDPYRIWLSEVMLQQTQVNTVVSYYKRWLEEFPTLESVAKADLDQILKVWEGLGYYSRARNFHAACQEVLIHHEGRVPSDPEVFYQLKGVGPYTCAAVQSIVFNHPLAAIDGNVKRVVSRLRCIPVPPSKAIKDIEIFLDSHISKPSPGDFNQAMMELGATVCAIRNPKCTQCPVSKYCEAFQSDSVQEYPKPESRKSRPKIEVAAGLIWKGNKVLIAKRLNRGMLGGMWEFPGGKVELGETLKTCVRREIKEELDIDVTVGNLECTVSHAYTHFSVDVSCFSCQYKSGTPKPLASQDLKWVRIRDLKLYAFPKSNHKMFPHLPKKNPFVMTSQKVR